MKFFIPKIGSLAEMADRLGHLFLEIGALLKSPFPQNLLESVPRHYPLINTEKN